MASLPQGERSGTDLVAEDEPEAVRDGREAMHRPVADYADPARPWRLDLQCAGTCQVQRRLVAELVPLVSPGLTWAEAIPKLRCSRCGEPVAIAGLNGPPKTPGGGAAWLLLQGTGRWRWQP
jgi:hypothetical protein